MEFLDRQPEMGRLDALARRRGGGLAVIWGRRRVGKTRLLLEWSRRHGGTYAVADRSAEVVQRRYFAETLSARFPDFARVPYPDWRTLLRLLSREASRANWRGPLILDEFPYLAAACPALPSVLQAWLDHEAREAGLVVAVAGSAQHMMQGLVLDPSAPLFGRATETLALAPLPPACLAPALGLSDPRDVVRAWAAWGGIPRYWELAEPYGRDLDAAVDAIVLDPLGALHQEPERLLASDLPSALSLRPVLDAIGSGAHRLSEIAGRLGQPATALSGPLARLTHLGLVRREQPFGDPERSGKRVLYRIADPFFRAWFAVVAPHRSALAEARPPERGRIWRQARPSLVAEAWEELARRCVPGIPRSTPHVGPAGPWGPARRLWGAGGPEWDVVALSADGKRLLLGEAKWHEGKTPSAAVRRAASDLLGKGVPRGAPFDGRQVVRAVFVPRAARTFRSPGVPVAVLDAEHVLAALR